ncbi:MAG: tRNA pseudouridine(55) synthase TruB [Clostridia bacterium]|nr:tRNA pseudouridine(55) synthase TruB [Clostridia bacterium]
MYVLNGIIVIDKPQGWTSHDVVAKLRGLLRERRIGHAGTLDPMATGVLPVFVGRATRAVEFAAEAGKEYIAGCKLGVITDTQDVTGTVLEERPVTASRAEVEAAMAAFRGDILQVPPMYSALKVEGKKLYELARKGKEVERQARPIHISAFELLEETGEGEYLIRIGCSKGTYVRTLCHDLGLALGCGGVMKSLRRTKSAGFTLQDAVTLEAVAEAAGRGEAARLLLPVDDYFQDLPAWRAEVKHEKRLRNGGEVPCDEKEGRYRVYGSDGTFLMVGEAKNGVMTTVKSFFEVE